MVIDGEEDKGGKERGCQAGRAVGGMWLTGAMVVSTLRARNVL